MNTWDTDKDFSEGKIEKVEPVDKKGIEGVEDDGKLLGWILEMTTPAPFGTTVRSMGFLPNMPTMSGDEPVPPQAGETARIYGSADDTRGLIIEGRVYAWRSKEDHAAAKVTEKVSAEAQRQTELDVSRPDRDARRAALPTPLRERMEGFLGYGPPEWRRDFEAHELEVCEAAAALAQRFPVVDVIKAYGEAPIKFQRSLAPGIGEGLEDHDGWTAALAMATFIVAKSPLMVPLLHAAACQRTGCRAQGCYGVRPGAGTRDEPSQAVIEAGAEAHRSRQSRNLDTDDPDASSKWVDASSKWVRKWVYKETIVP